MTTSSFLNRCVVALSCLALFPAIAAAQPVPDAGQVAAGAEIGMFIPADEATRSGIVGGGLIEFYATPRVGIRGTVTAIRNGYEREDDDERAQLRFGADVIYNWEYGAVHPFVGAGVGDAICCASIATATTKARTTPSSAPRFSAARVLPESRVDGQG